MIGACLHFRAEQQNMLGILFVTREDNYADL